nr:endonuclease/exonuclease/phosphatase family protein [uncultured Oscillibacter sp.]
MKLLTLNTHSLQGEDPEKNLEALAAFLLRERPGVAAFQEVNQLRDAAPADPRDWRGYVPAAVGVSLRRGNFAAGLAARLQEAGVPCSWTWRPVKMGYDRFDEGLALFSLLAPIAEIDVICLSLRDDYGDWRTRKALGVRLEDRPDWFYSVHLGWWGDADPFRDQWARLEAGAAEKRARGPVWLLGDFNAPAHVRGQGYDLVESSGWRDVFRLAGGDERGDTVRGAIDGWRERLPGEVPEGMRIDYIWCSQTPEVRRAGVVLDGGDSPVVSDHFGVLAETEEV